MIAGKTPAEIGKAGTALASATSFSSGSAASAQVTQVMHREGHDQRRWRIHPGSQYQMRWPVIPRTHRRKVVRFVLRPNNQQPVRRGTSQRAKTAGSRRQGSKTLHPGCKDDQQPRNHPTRHARPRSRPKVRRPDNAGHTQAEEKTAWLHKAKDGEGQTIITQILLPPQQQFRKMIWSHRAG